MTGWRTVSHRIDATRSQPDRTRRPAVNRRQRAAREHLRTVHSPARRDDAADGGHRAGRCRRIRTAAGVAAPASGLSNHLGVRGPAGRKSRDNGLGGGDAARTAVRPNRRRHRNDFVEFAGLDQHHAAIRSRSRHRCGRPRRPSGDQRRARLPAGEPALESQLPQGKPGRLSDHDPVADLGDPQQGRDVRRRLHGDGAIVVADSRGWAGRGRRGRAAGGPRRSEPHDAEQVRYRSRTGPYRDRRDQRQHSERADFGQRPALGGGRQRSTAEGGGLPTSDRGLPQWLCGSDQRCRARRRTRSKTSGPQGT